MGTIWTVVVAVAMLCLSFGSLGAVADGHHNLSGPLASLADADDREAVADRYDLAYDADADRVQVLIEADPGADPLAGYDAEIEASHDLDDLRLIEAAVDVDDLHAIADEDGVRYVRTPARPAPADDRDASDRWLDGSSADLLLGAITTLLVVGLLLFAVMHRRDG